MRCASLTWRCGTSGREATQIVSWDREGSQIIWEDRKAMWQFSKRVNSIAGVRRIPASSRILAGWLPELLVKEDERQRAEQSSTDRDDDQATCLVSMK